MLVHQVDDRTKFKTASGRFLEHRDGSYRDEIGRFTYPRDYDEDCSVIQDWPGLNEHETFELITKPIGHPNQAVIFKCVTSQFRVLVRLNNYKFAIPFNFQSTDPRVGRHQAEWRSPAYKALEVMWQKSLSIKFDDVRPILYCDSWKEVLQIGGEIESVS